jgi:hypothetical protein
MPNKDEQCNRNHNDEQEVEDARVGYQVATSLRTSRADELWSQFNGIMTANAIILAATFVSSNDPESDRILRIGMPIVGLILTAFWLVLHARGTSYSQYYLLSARELEEKYLGDTVRTLSRGGKLAKGEEVELYIGGQAMKIRMSLPARLFRVRNSAYLVILAFAGIYLALLFC